MQEHAPCARKERCPRCQHAGASRARVGANDGHIAKAALVRVAKARRKQMRECHRVSAQPGVLECNGIARTSEVEDDDIARAIGACCHVQPRLIGNESERYGGMDGGCLGAAHNDATIGINATGHIEGNDRNVRCVGARHPLRIGSGHRALQTNAKQAVDDGSRAYGRWPLIEEWDAGHLSVLERLEGVGRWRPCPQSDHPHLTERLMESRRGDQCVAAIVAGAGQKKQRPVDMRHQPIGNGLPSTLHQCACGQLRGPCSFDGTNIGDAQDGQHQ